VSIPEASLDKIRLGLPALVTVDTLPGERFVGHVVSIAPLPNAQSAFLNPDLKLYDTVVRLDNNGSLDLLRAGMSCNVEIIVEQYDEAIYIPIQAVLRVGKTPTAYVIHDKKLEPRRVDIGLDNNSMVRIVSGLDPGELVSLAPPLVQAAVKEPDFEKIPEIPPVSSTPSPSTNRSGLSTPPDTASSPSMPPPQMGVGGSQPSDTTSQQRSGARPGDRFRTLDKDGDGKLSKDEFPTSPEVFDRLDKNKDGYVSMSEIPQRPSGGSRPSAGRSEGESSSGGPYGGTR
jgi:HlyD family secretion protein